MSGILSLAAVLALTVDPRCGAAAPGSVSCEVLGPSSDQVVNLDVPVSKVAYGVAYCITNQVNGKRYIGVTKRNPKRRWEAHRRHGRTAEGQARMLYRSMSKHGIEAFTFSVVASASSHATLCDLERTLIAQLSSFWTTGKGYNLSRGGDGQVGLIHSQATRTKMGNTRRGRKFSDAHKEAIRQANTGKLHSADARAKVSAANTGRPMSDKTKNALLLSNIGRNPYARPVQTPAGEFLSLKQAALALGMSFSTVKRKAEQGANGWAFKAEQKPS